MLLKFHSALFFSQNPWLLPQVPVPQITAGHLEETLAWQQAVLVLRSLRMLQEMKNLDDLDSELPEKPPFAGFNTETDRNGCTGENT